MTHIHAVDVNKGINSKAATYNAVKIQVNEPRTCIPEGFKSSPEDNGTYNAVAIEVNRPSVEAGNCSNNHNCVYDYPKATCPVCADKAIAQRMPILPVAYQTTNFINNRTLINAELEVEKECKCESKECDCNKPNATLPEAEVVVLEEVVVVPEPNVTTVEEQKLSESEISFHGLTFKAKESQNKVEIVPPVEIKPDVDIQKVVSKLSDKNFDIQALQMEEIAKASMENPQKAIPYIVTEVFSELINIVKADTTTLPAPSEKQIETRKQIIVNEIIKEQAKAENKDLSELELPYEVSEADIKEASILSPMEQAERNKEYALYTMAILAKVYTDEVEKQTNNVVPLTDLPGVSEIVDTLRENSNPTVKIAAMDALRYLNRKEYNDEIRSILSLASQDENPYIAANATLSLENLN